MAIQVRVDENTPLKLKVPFTMAFQIGAITDAAITPIIAQMPDAERVVSIFPAMSPMGAVKCARLAQKATTCAAALKIVATNKYWVARLFVAERDTADAETLELLKSDPHPAVAETAAERLGMLL